MPAQAMVPPGVYAAASGQAPATVFVPTAAYPTAAMYPQPMAPASYMNAAMPMGQGQPGMMPAQMMPAQMAMGPAPDVYGAYGYMPVNYAGPEAAMPGYGGAPGYPMPGAMPGYGGPDMGMQGYGQPMNGDQGYGGGPGYEGQGGMDGACPYCGGQGCDMCGGIFGHHGHHGDGTWLPNGLLGDIFGCIAPYPDGGCAAVRWYDFAVDYMMLKRDNTGRSQTVHFAWVSAARSCFRQTISISAATSRASGSRRRSRSAQPTAWSSRTSVSSTTRRRRRSLGRRQFVLDLQQLWSRWRFRQAFPEFDQANFQQINYQSTFDSFEVNWRHRWMAPNCRYQGSWTLGVRHFILDENVPLRLRLGANGFPGAAFRIYSGSRLGQDTSPPTT